MTDNNIKIAFIGGLFPKEIRKNIMSNTIGQPQNAADLLQWNLIEGLEKNINSPITIINSLFIGSFPQRYKKLFINPQIFNHSSNEKHKDYNIGFINLPFVKQISRTKSIKRFLDKYSRIRQMDLAIGYSMTLPIVMGLKEIKKINPSIKTCLVVPDLPEYMNLSKDKGILYNAIKKYNNKLLYEAIQDIDCFVVLTKYMADALEINDKPFAVIEGMTKARDNIVEYNDSVKKFVYTGSLGSKYGILDLVDAFHRLDEENVELVICGGGETTDYIKGIAAIDSRIKYKGVLTPEEVYKIQQDAYILVNPRNSKEIYTKYSFPSKTLEYLASGHPVLMYHLPGIPEDYDDYILYIDETKDSLYQGLKKSISMDSKIIKDKGILGKQFVENNKTSDIQTKKILDMYDSLCKVGR
ncbi:MAG TPA: hypothetical protein DCW44_05140 [Eubacterium sp.]|nr:hypothetical protein [Eubacterium sp.]